MQVDVWGPYKTLSHDGYKFFLTIVDDFRWHTYVHMLTRKIYAFTLIKSFITYVQTQYQMTVKAIKIDNALEISSSYEGVNFFPMVFFPDDVTNWLDQWLWIGIQLLIGCY